MDGITNCFDMDLSFHYFRLLRCVQRFGRVGEVADAIKKLRSLVGRLQSRNEGVLKKPFDANLLLHSILSRTSFYGKQGFPKFRVI
jgi:hypothetical protein